jgi:hypothetical protein
MRRTSLLLLLTVCLLASLPARAAATREEILPAGTIIHCTLDEPNFSSKTAQAGDPVLCHLASVSSFGHSIFPRGAMLSGHLQDSKDPGRLVGKGWLELEFDRIILPGAEVLPLQAKIVAAPRLKVDREGKMHGKGHPTRDALGWMVPVLWPIKIVTLPMRGPYPALKGESRLTMRLMEDVDVPVPASFRASVPAPPWARPSSYAPASYGLLQPASLVTREPVSAVPVSAVATEDGAPVVTPRPVEPLAVSATGPARSQPSALVVLHGGSAFLAREYWIQSGQMHCLSEDGEAKAFPLESVDLYQTVKVNRERNVEFSLRTKDAVTEQ